MIGYSSLTQRAENALRRAEQEGRLRGCTEVTPAMILVGVLEDRMNTAYLVLHSLGIDHLALLMDARRLIPRTDMIVQGVLPFSIKAEELVQARAVEAKRITGGHKNEEVGSQHLLFGLLLLGDDDISHVFESHGVVHDTVRRKVALFSQGSLQFA